MEIDFVGMEVREEQYSIEYLPLFEICYRKLTSTLVRNSTQLVGNKTYEQYYQVMEKQVATGPPFEFPQEIYNVLGPLIDSNALDLYQVFRHLKKTRKMYNPVLVVKEVDGLYYMVRGGQRICALRALGFVGEIPCRVLRPDDPQSEKTNPAIMMHPYVPVDYHD